MDGLVLEAEYVGVMSLASDSVMLVDWAPSGLVPSVKAMLSS